MPSCCFVSFHFLWAILWPHPVNVPVSFSFLTHSNMIQICPALLEVKHVTDEETLLRQTMPSPANFWPFSCESRRSKPSLSSPSSSSPHRQSNAADHRRCACGVHLRAVRNDPNGFCSRQARSLQDIKWRRRLHLGCENCAQAAKRVFTRPNTSMCVHLSKILHRLARELSN